MTAAGGNGGGEAYDLPEGVIVDEVDAAVALYSARGTARPLNALARELGPLGLDAWADLEGRAVTEDAFPPLVAIRTGTQVGGAAFSHTPSRRVLRISAAPLNDLAVVTLVDVSTEVEQRDELRRQFDGLQRLVASVGEHLFTVEVRDGVAQDLFTGTGAERLLGGKLPEGADPHAVWIERMEPEDRAAFLAAVGERARGVANEVTYRLRGFDGRVRWVLDRGYPSPGGDGAMLIDGVAVDVTEMRRLAAELEEARHEAERRSRIDSLTETFNRRHFGEALAAELTRAAGGTSRPGVILLDIDDFKRVNDTWGHAAGDAVLVGVAERLRAAVREFDCVARYGGEEFAILVPEVSDAELRAMAETLAAAVRDEPFRLPDGQRVRVTVSAGAALATGAHAGAVLAAADRALYAAKRRGRDRACLDGDLVAAPGVADEPEAMRLARALAVSASLHEPSADGHAEEVSDLAGRIATAMGLPADVVLRCRLAGMLRDVGRLGIADAVLAREDAGDPAAESVLRTHTVIGEDLALRVPGLAAVAGAIRHHHEHVDGSGYPDGLRGDEIPVESRVVAVADAYVRFAHAAPPALEPLVAIRGLTGSRLDPAAVGALAATLGGELADAA